MRRMGGGGVRGWGVGLGGCKLRYLGIRVGRLFSRLGMRAAVYVV